MWHFKGGFQVPFRPRSPVREPAQLIADANKDDGSLLRCALRGAMFPFPRPHLPPALVHPSPSFRREFLDESGRAGQEADIELVVFVNTVPRYLGALVSYSM